MDEPETQQTELKRNIHRILDSGKVSGPDLSATRTRSQEESDLSPEAEDLRPPCFTVQPTVEGNNNTESFIPIFSFLEGQDYRPEFGVLYGLSSALLSSSTFCGHSEEDELISFLGVARETARKKRLFWSQTRLCFLLGKLCAGRLKFSQARVYFEEALSLPREAFKDLRLLASIYSNLATIYLLQKNSESFFDVTQRLVALILGIPDCLQSLEDNSALKYFLKKAVLSHNQRAEARACFLLAKHHWSSTDQAQAVPYLERLLVLCADSQRVWSISVSHGYLSLGRLYSQLSLPYLSVSSARRASLQPSAKLSDCLHSMSLVLDNVCKLNGITEQETSVPPQVAPFLHQALGFIEVQNGGTDLHLHHVLVHQLTVCLCQLFYKHRMVGRAVHLMHRLVNNSPPQQQVTAATGVSVPERNGALIWLAWLHIDNNQPSVALDILDAVLSLMPEHCTTPQEGQWVFMVTVTVINQSI